MKKKREIPESKICTGCACHHPRGRCVCLDECCNKPVDCDHYEPRGAEKQEAQP